MNIGIVTTWFERGAAYVSKAYMRVLSRSHKVFIYARGGEEYAKGDQNWDLPNVTWEKGDPSMSKIHFINCHDFYKWIKANDIEVLIFNEQRSWEILLKLQYSDILLGAYVDYYTPETIPFFKLYDFLLCNTKKHYKVFENFSQTFYIPWGTDIQLCSPKKKPSQKNEIVFFHSAGMGGVNLRKGTDILVKAFKRVRGNAKLLIHSQVGLEKFSSVANIIQNDDRIEFIEDTVPLPGLYHKGDVYVYPTRLEGIGLSIVEALACGLPVITTDSPPMNEFVIHKKTGYLVKVAEFQRRFDNYFWSESICDEHDLFAAMQYYADNQWLIPFEAASARRYATKNLDWDKNAKDLARKIKELGKNRSVSKKEIQAIKRYDYQRTSTAMLIGAKFALAEKNRKNALKLVLAAIKRRPKKILLPKTWFLIGKIIIGIR